MPVQKDKGWEFTDLSKLRPRGLGAAGDGDLDAQPAREAVVARRRRRACCRSTARPCAAATAARRRRRLHARRGGRASTPTLVEPHLGALVQRPRQVRGAEHRGAGAAALFVHVPRRRRGRGADRRVRDPGDARSALPWRSLIVVEAGAQVTVAEQWLSADADLEGYFNPVTELVVGEGASRRVPLRAGPLRAQLDPRQPARAGRRATPRCTGSGSASAPARASCGWRPTSTARGASARVTGAYVGHGRQHIDYDTTQEHAAPAHDFRPRLPRDPARPRDRGLERHDQGRPRRAAHRRLPGEPQPAAHRRRPRRRDPGPRDRGQRRALHARGDGRAARRGPALLPAEPRARRAPRPSACWSAASSR